MKIVEYTNEQLTTRDLPPLQASKNIVDSLHHKNLASRFNLRLEIIWNRHMADDAKISGFTLMVLGGFRELLFKTRGFPVVGRRGDNDEDAWFQRNQVLRLLRSLEEEISRPSIELCLNKKTGFVLLDDKLIGSRAQDVEK